jgi:hypothetical protein
MDSILSQNYTLYFKGGQKSFIFQLWQICLKKPLKPSKNNPYKTLEKLSKNPQKTLKKLKKQ